MKQAAACLPDGFGQTEPEMPTRKTGFSATDRAAGTQTFLNSSGRPAGRPVQEVALAGFQSGVSVFSSCLLLQVAQTW
jgi:hypothetical protein